MLFSSLKITEILFCKKIFFFFLFWSSFSKMTVCPFGSPSENDEERSRSIPSPEQAAQNAPNAPSAQNVNTLEIVRVYLFLYKNCLFYQKRNLLSYKKKFLDIECRMLFWGAAIAHKNFGAQWHTPYFLSSILSFTILFQVSRINAVTKQQVILDTGRTNFQVRNIKLEFLSLTKVRS